MSSRLRWLAGVLMAFVMLFSTAYAEDVGEAETDERPVFVLEHKYDSGTGEFVISVYLRDMPSLIAGGSLGLEFAQRLGDYTFKAELPSIEMFYRNDEHKHFFHFMEAEASDGDITLSGIDAVDNPVLLCTYTFNVTGEVARSITKDAVSLVKFDLDEKTKDLAAEVIDDIFKYDEAGVGCYQGVPFSDDENGAYDSEETFNIYLENNLPETAGVTVFGKIRSYDPKKTAKVELINSDNSDLVYSVDVFDTVGNGKKVQSFEINGVMPGRYVLKITKPSHLSYTKQMVEVSSDDVVLSGLDGGDGDIATLLCGDVNGDGVIKLADRNLILASKHFGKKASDDKLKIYDLDGDGYIKFSDVNIMMLSENFNKCNVVIP